jgi:predicted CopG family antitoxin
MSKTITIKKSVYDELKGFKKENESFSELLDRLIKSQSKKDVLKSLRGSIEFENKEKLLKEIEKKRWEKRN